jgi:hypothetical protein
MRVEASQTEKRPATAFRARPVPAATRTFKPVQPVAPKPLTEPTAPRLRTEERAMFRRSLSNATRPFDGVSH